MNRVRARRSRRRTSWRAACRVGSLAWRAPLVAAAGVVVRVLATEAGLPRAGLLGAGGGCAGRLAAAVPLLGGGPHLAARRLRRAPHCSPAPPPDPGGVRSFPRPCSARECQRER